MQNMLEHVSAWNVLLFVCTWGKSIIKGATSMTQLQLIGLIISTITGTFIVALSIVMMTRKSATPVEHCNSFAKKEKDNKNALARFLGKILFHIGFFMPFVAVACIFNIKWVAYAYAAFVFLLSTIAFFLYYSKFHLKK